MTVFFQIKTFSNTLIKTFTLIKMLMFSKLFISCLSRRIVRIESAGKGLLRERHLCRTFKLNKNSFCQQRAGFEVLIKVTSKADRWKQSGKSFTKI